MDVRLSAEQHELRASVTKLVERLGPGSVIDLDDTGRAARLDAALERAGVRQLRGAGDDGAPIATTVEVALVAEVLAAGLADAPFLGPTLAVELRRVAGAAPAGQRETVAFSGDLGEVTVADGSRTPDGSLAVDAAGATAALVVVAAAEGQVLASVPVEGPTANTDAAAGVDLTRPTVPVGAAQVGRIERSAALTDEQLSAWRAFGLALATAELVGVMDGAIRLARDYALGREQYGSPIGSYQAVQHLLAEAYVLLEGSRSAALYAAWAVDELPAAEALTAASMAKAYAARSVRQVVETCIQVHGGIGNTWEHLPHVYLRRALVAADLLGGVGASLDRIMGAYRIGA